MTFRAAAMPRGRRGVPKTVWSLVSGAGGPGPPDLQRLRRELERGPLQNPEAKEFGNCEVRVYQADRSRGCVFLGGWPLG